MKSKIVNSEKVLEVIHDIEEVFKKHELSGIDRGYVLECLMLAENAFKNSTMKKAVSMTREIMRMEEEAKKDL